MNKITVITVSYNAEKDILKTIESVVNQTKCNEIDYIIMDGKSQDNTVMIAEDCCRKYKSYLSDFRIISEKDCGVYDAMNKATLLSKGSYIIFMNAGDIFVDKYVIEDFLTIPTYQKYDVIYGDTVCIKNGKPVVEQAGNSIKLKYKKPFCHQSAFIKSQIQNKYKFNCEYKIQADYDFFLRIYIDKKKFYRWNRKVSIFDTQGMSSNVNNRPLIFAEMKELHKKNGINFLNTPILLPYYIKCWKSIK